MSQWQVVLSEALHSLRTLLRTATNEAPHDRIFKFLKRSMSGRNVPVWLTETGTVLVRKHVRDKYDPHVDEVDSLSANQNYAVIRHPSGREAAVSTTDLAPTALYLFFFSCIFILISRESDQCAIRARLGVASHLSTTPRWGNPAKCLSQRHNK